MKKLIAIALALVLVLGLAACGAKAPAAAATKVSVFWYDEADVYLSTVRAELNKALEEAGIAYDNQFAGKDQAKQLEQVKTAIAGGSNLLVVNVVTSGDPDVAQSIVDAAGDIPVVFFNRAIGTEGTDVTMLSANATACFIGTDAPEAGHMQGKMIGEYVLANFDTVDLNKDGKITYAMFKGEEGNAEAIARTQFGVEDADAVLTAAGKPALEYFDAQAAQKWQTDPEGAWSAKAAKDYMDTNLVSYNESNGNMIELVICNNDGMAEGAVASLQQAGYNVAGAHVVPVFGVDATDAAKALIADGAMIGTVKQDNVGMAVAICETVKAIAGGKTPVEAMAGLNDARFTIAGDCATKLYVAYSPYTGE
ncbi:MAG: substrate-binding domain-containing protein [Oscillospiraceae bacterium]|nr:substrate-binding domain-containing protein [Oscillospiraceae bacterium]